MSMLPKDTHGKKKEHKEPWLNAGFLCVLLTLQKKLGCLRSNFGAALHGAFAKVRDNLGFDRCALLIRVTHPNHLKPALFVCNQS